MESLDSWSDLPPPYGSNWDHNIVDFVLLPYISFIDAFKYFECMKGYWEKRCAEFI